MSEQLFKAEEFFGALMGLPAGKDPLKEASGASTEYWREQLKARLGGLAAPLATWTCPNCQFKVPYWQAKCPQCGLDLPPVGPISWPTGTEEEE